MPYTLSSAILMLVALSSVVSQQPKDCADSLEHCTKEVEQRIRDRTQNDPMQTLLDIHEGQKLLTQDSNFIFNTNATALQKANEDAKALLTLEHERCTQEFIKCMKKYSSELKRKRNAPKIKAVKKQKHKTRHR